VTPSGAAPGPSNRESPSAPDPPTRLGPLRPLTHADAVQIATWRYPPPFDLYDSSDDPAGYDPPDSDGYGFWVVDAEDGSGVVAFVCLGPEGRVAGQVDEPGTLDVGMGIRPDTVSQGRATALVPAVLDAVAAGLRPSRLRTAVAAFNERSLRLCRSAGLVERRRFDGPSGRPFVELVADVREMPGDSASPSGQA
jgi:ribosomal-protein-alanine N-acetyltransferase